MITFYFRDHPDEKKRKVQPKSVHIGDDWKDELNNDVDHIIMDNGALDSPDNDLFIARNAVPWLASFIVVNDGSPTDLILSGPFARQFAWSFSKIVQPAV